MEKYRLTTTDNPFNPYTQWDDWYFFDMSEGYNTCERLARLIGFAPEIPYPLFDNLQEEAMDQLIELGAISKSGNAVGYKKVENPDLNSKK